MMLDILTLALRVAAALAASHAAGRYLAPALRAPTITLQLATGVLAGPALTGLLDAPTLAALSPLCHLALAFICFAAGAELRLRPLLPQLPRILRATACTSALALGALSGAVLWATAPGRGLLPSAVERLPLACRAAASLLAGAILASSSPAAAIAVAREARARGPFTTSMLGITMLADVAALAAFAAAKAVAQAACAKEGGLLAGGEGEEGLLRSLGAIAASLLVGAALGQALGQALLVLRAGGCCCSGAAGAGAGAGAGALVPGVGWRLPRLALLLGAAAAALLPLYASAPAAGAGGVGFGAWVAAHLETLLVCIAAGAVAVNAGDRGSGGGGGGAGGGGGSSGSSSGDGGEEKKDEGGGEGVAGVEGGPVGEEWGGREGAGACASAPLLPAGAGAAAPACAAPHTALPAAPPAAAWATLPHLLDAASPPLFLLFFTAVGAGLNLAMVSHCAGFALLFSVLRGGCLFLGAWAAGLWGATCSSSSSSSVEGAAAAAVPLTLALVTQAGLSIGLAGEVGRRFPSWGHDIESAVVGVVLINQVAGPWLCALALRMAGEAGMAVVPSGGSGGGGGGGASAESIAVEDAQE